MADVLEVLRLRDSGGVADAVPTSLVTEYGTNADKGPSYRAERRREQRALEKGSGHKKRPECPSPVLFTETCGHGNQRPWLRPCDKWTCRQCCSWRVETELVPELVKGMQWARRMGWTLKFYTLTWRSADVAAGTSKEAARRRRKDLANFVKWFRRKYGFFEYLRVSENHLSGKVHLHLVVVCPYVAQKELSAQWKVNARGAFRIDVEAVGIKCPRCYPGPSATRAEKRRSMIIPPPDIGECRCCGLRLEWTGFTDVDVAVAASKELGKYLSKSVPVTYLLGKGRRQPIARSKGWRLECGVEQPDSESEPPCSCCNVNHTHSPVGKDDVLRVHYLGVAEDGGFLWHMGRCECWRGMERVRGPALWVGGSGGGGGGGGGIDPLG